MPNNVDSDEMARYQPSILFVFVLRIYGPVKPNGVMSSAVSLR